MIFNDIRRKQDNYLRINNPFNKYIKLVLQLGTLYVITYRLSQNKLVGFIFKIPQVILSFITGISIRNSTIGTGFVIHNFSGIKINNAQIGDSVTINQDVIIMPNIGDFAGPVIGRGCYIGSGVKVIGDVIIGDNVTISANSLVIDNVESNRVISGIPARTIIKSHGNNV